MAFWFIWGLPLTLHLPSENSHFNRWYPQICARFLLSPLLRERCQDGQTSAYVERWQLRKSSSFEGTFQSQPRLCRCGFQLWNVLMLTGEHAGSQVEVSLLCFCEIRAQTPRQGHPKRWELPAGVHLQRKIHFPWRRSEGGFSLQNLQF